MILPDDIIKNVNQKNWLKLFRRYMIFENDYVWQPEVTEKFIKAILKNYGAEKNPKRVVKKS